MSKMFMIQLQNESMIDNCIELAQSLKASFGDFAVVLFKPISMQIDSKGIETVDFPTDCDNKAKMKNFMLKAAKERDPNAFLSLIEQNVKLLKDPVEFINALQMTMDALDYSIYFSTTSDSCNYVFSKMNPRVTIDMDDEDVRSKLNLPRSISFTSHSNTAWIVYDMKRLDDILLFDEKFSIMMYIIIEYLARRRKSKKDGQLYFMNQYLSIPEEIGAFTTLNVIEDRIDQEVMKHENEIFKNMNIDYSPDNNVDIVLEMLYAKINEKMKIASINK